MALLARNAAVQVVYEVHLLIGEHISLLAGSAGFPCSHFQLERSGPL